MSGEVEALFVAQPEVGFEFVVTDFNFPALPSPKQQGFKGEWEYPLSMFILEGVDEERQRFTAGTSVVFTAHDNQDKRTVGSTLTEQHPAHFDL